MTSKRRAVTDLNADNWNDVEEPEEAGTFQVASEQDLQTRVIRTAKRRSNMASDDNKKGVFSSFGGFKKTPTSTAPAPFSFLSSLKNGSSTSTIPITTNTPKLAIENKIETQSIAAISPMPTKVTSAEGTTLQSTGGLKGCPASSLKYSDEYCAHLKDLNQSICEWIKQNVEKNPYCILTPIFEDYKKYLKEFDKYKESDKKTSPASVNEANSGEVKKSAEVVQVSDNIFSSVLTPQSSVFQTPKPSDKAQSKTSVSQPPSFLSQGFSSTPVSKVPPMFSFSQNTPIASSNNFSFGASSKPFTFQSNAIAEETKSEQNKEEENEEEEEPPKTTFTQVVEENSEYSKRCKVYVTSNGEYSDRGVGTLYLKAIANSEKYQLIVRADTSLGNLLLNMVLSKSIPTKRIGKNNVLLVTIPTPESKPPPVPVLLRVKSGEEADELLETLDKYKK